MKKMKYNIIMFLFIIGLLLITCNTTIGANKDFDSQFKATNPSSLLVYTPKFNALNIKEMMTLSPMFTPDNALTIHKAWIDCANSSIDVQNQYITKFDGGDWDTDSSPIVRALVDANNSRGVNVRVQVNEDSDSDDVTSYFESKGIAVRWMGTSFNNLDGEYLSTTHNKLVIIDKKVTLLSSINFGVNAFTNNREAGMVIQNPAVANYYASIFESDWNDGEVPPSPLTNHPVGKKSLMMKSNSRQRVSYTSPTNIPKANFTDTYNVTLFANPDNANEVIFRYLKEAKTSIYVSMYTISRPDFNKTLIDLKQTNPSMDIQVLISNRRVGSYENIDTASAARSLVENLIPVYNSTKDLNYYHNKYWIIDGKHVFVYSGNWSPRSVSKLDSGDAYFLSNDVNRDMGIAVHDASDIASFFKNSVWDADVAVADAWDLPIGIKQTCFSEADVISGTVTLSAQIAGLDNPTVSYRWGSGDYIPITLDDNAFSVQFDTRTIPNGIETFEVRAKTATQTFSDKVRVNIVNFASNENWRLLITELLPDPSAVSDTEGEYIELTNSFPFDLLIENWQIGDDKNLYTFPSDYTIDKYSSVVIAKDSTGFQNAYGKTADIELAIALTNSGDFVQLLDHRGNYIDVVAYGDATAPDGSEVLEAPDAGKAILRTPLHIDTNTIKDFDVGSPDPKGIVPHASLITKEESTDTSSEDTSLSWGIIIISLILFPVVRRRSK